MTDEDIERRLLDSGGRLQRDAAQEEAGGAVRGPRCKLSEALLYLVGWGDISLPNMNWLARCALEGFQLGEPHADLVALAGLGASGEYPGNLRRDLFRKFVPSWDLPRPIAVAVEGRDRLDHDVEVDQHLLNPTQLVETVWQKYPEQWEQLIGSDPEGFWNSLRPDDPKLDALGGLRETPGWEACSYPFILHGDGGCYSRKTQESILIVSIKSMLTETFQENLIPAFVLPKGVRRKAGDATAEEMWAALVHQLNALFDGLHPRQDHRGSAWPPGSAEERWAGHPICEGRARIVIFAITGDLEYMGNELGLPHHNSNAPCMFCLVTRSKFAACHATDCRRDAPWKGQLFFQSPKRRRGRGRGTLLQG